MTSPTETAPLNLSQAIDEWCDPNLVAEFRSVLDLKFEEPANAMFATSGSDEWKVRRYYELRTVLLLQLATLIRNGTLIITGFSALTPVGPAGEISADLWPLLEFDLRDSSARLHGVKIAGIKLAVATKKTGALQRK